MTTVKRIRIAIIDDDKEAIFALQGFLELIPDIELVGTATTYQKALKLIKEQTPELLFLDIEMPGKTGFELLKELENSGHKNNMKVIFHTAYDKYTIQALRESAFDFILKPPTESELREAVQRYLKLKLISPEPKTPTAAPAFRQMLALPTSTGLQFIPQSEIVYFESIKGGLGIRSVWSAMLNSKLAIKLRSNTKADNIIEHLGSDNFIQLSQSAIVNISFVNVIAYKTHECFLFPPFDAKPIKVSRQYMAALREKFDVI